MTKSRSMGTEQIEALIIQFILNELVGDEQLDIDVNENLLSGGIVDSVGIVRLTAHMREQLDVTVPPKDLIPDNFRSIRVMASYMQSLLPG